LIKSKVCQACKAKAVDKDLFVFAALIFAKHVFDVDYLQKFCWPFYAFA